MQNTGKKNKKNASPPLIFMKKSMMKFLEKISSCFKKKLFIYFIVNHWMLGFSKELMMYVFFEGLKNI